MNDFETRLAGRIHNLADAENGAPPTENLLARGRSGRRRRRMVGGALVAAAVAAGVLAGTVSWSAPGQTPDQPTVAAPAVRLAAAVAASDNVSYRVRVTTSYGTDSERPATTSVVEGAFDPATRTGYLNSVPQPGTGGAALERLVDGIRYTGCEYCDDQWKQELGTHDRLAYADAMNGVASASADPEALFDALTQAGAKITQTDAGFHFEVDTKDQYGEYPVTLVGDVKLGQDNRIASVTYEETVSIPKTNGPGPAPTVTTTTDPGQPTTTTEAPEPTEFYTDTQLVTVELFDYGTPVRVERPTDVVVVQENP
jgi:hypothetical protein